MAVRTALIGPIFLGSLILGGCANWPEERGGGAAELAPPQEAVNNNDETASWSGTLYLRLSLVESELERIRFDGGMERFPAALTLAEKLSVRVRRQLAGGLEVDAAIDLLRLEEHLERLLAKQNDRAEQERVI